MGEVMDVVPFNPRKPLWLYPNLLSLDAPLVALAWLYLFSQTWRLYIPWEVYVVLGLGVWVIYSVDRLLDSALNTSGDYLSARHQFHVHYRKYFGIGIVFSSLLVLSLVVFRMPFAAFKMVLPGLGLVAGFFGFSMVSGAGESKSTLVKNILAGTAFSFGTAILAHLYRHDVSLFGMLISREFVSFTMLCILNICAIDLWENDCGEDGEELVIREGMIQSGWLSLGLMSLTMIALIFAVFEGRDVEESIGYSQKPFFYAVLASSGLLYLTHRCRDRFNKDMLRALADAALLVGFLVYIVTAR